MEKRIFYITLILSAILFLGTGIYDNFLQTLLGSSDKPLPGAREYNESPKQNFLKNISYEKFK